jgi:hypothetical protein
MRKIALYMIPLMMVALFFLVGQAIAEDDICDGYEGAAHGLCTAYCEAMDCDNEEHHANKKACDVVYLRYVKKTGNPPPCEVVDPCPAWDSGELESMWNTYESMCFINDDKLDLPYASSSLMWGDAAVYDDDNYVWANIQFFPTRKAAWGQVIGGTDLQKKEWPLTIDEYRACVDRLKEHVAPAGFSSCNP